MSSICVLMQSALRQFCVGSAMLAPAASPSPMFALHIPAPRGSRNVSKHTLHHRLAAGEATAVLRLTARSILSAPGMPPAGGTCLTTCGHSGHIPPAGTDACRANDSYVDEGGASIAEPAEALFEAHFADRLPEQGSVRSKVSKLPQPATNRRRSATEETTCERACSVRGRRNPQTAMLRQRNPQTAACSDEGTCRPPHAVNDTTSERADTASTASGRDSMYKTNLLW